MIPLLSDRHPAVQVALVIAGPVLFGALCGVLLGISESAYLIASILAILGGFFAGFEHPGAGQGVLRGAIGGTLFGSFILIGHAIHGHEAKADLPHPHLLLIVATAAFGMILGAVGGHVRGRVEASAATP